MSTLKPCTNMEDVKLKPGIIRTLIRTRLPEDDQPSRHNSNLSDLISTVRTHRLLSESTGTNSDDELLPRWKSAVDDWLQRLLKLVSSDVPDECWTGICLLGLTCQECSDERFLASYSVWFDKVHSCIQRPTESQLVKVAACNSLSDIIIRLGRLANLKKDGSILTGKLIQSALKLLKDDDSEIVCEGGVNLLSTSLTVFPAAVNRYYDSVEAAIAYKLLSGKCSVNTMKKLASCLALLPNSRGDGDSWGLMMQKILLFINHQLTGIFEGLEEGTKGTEAGRELVPPGTENPPPLGGLGDVATMSDQSQMSTICMLMVCCCKMLTGSHPVKASVPIRSLLSLVERVIMVDGSVSRDALPFMNAKQHESVCLLLPDLHSYSLELLKAIIEGMHSQLLPHAGYVVRLIKTYFKRCSLPSLRIRLYAVMKSLLIFMGVGIGLSLAQDIVDSTLVDLTLVGYESRNLKPALSQLKKCGNRKRKHSEEQNEKTELEVEAPMIHPSQIHVKIAALDMLEFLLSVGGGIKFETWRPDVDNLLFTLAAESCKDGWAYEENSNFFSNEPVITWADYQLAALRALKTSLLSATRFRPPHLARGLDLFRRGKREAGSKISGFCMQAVLALEAIIHPRALPLEEVPSTRLSDIGKQYSNDDDDDLYLKWLGKENHKTDSDLALGTTNNVVETMMDSYQSNRSNEQSQEPASVHAMETRNNAVETVMEPHQLNRSNTQSQEPAPDIAMTNNAYSLNTEIERIEKDDEVTTSGGNIMTENRDRFADVADTAENVHADKGKAAVFDMDDEDEDEDDDSFGSAPHIVDSDGEELTSD